MTQILLVRHGQTAWNRVERFRGRADIPLDEVGLEQARCVGRYIADTWQPTAIYASPLRRTMQTAEAIAQPLALPVQPHPGLLDIDYGEWQGLTPEEVAARWPEALERWYHASAALRIPGGESLERVRERGMAAVHALTAQHASETIVLVGHTVINRVLLLTMLGAGLKCLWRLRQDPGALNVIAVESGQFVLCNLNQTAHLQL